MNRHWLSLRARIGLREALAILDRLGAAPLAVIVRRRLRERGARGSRGPNETTRANPAGLTAKETEILALLAHGVSNAQLARRLHRSTKTIDHHVSAILDKLGVGSRTEAVAAPLRWASFLWGRIQNWVCLRQS